MKELLLIPIMMAVFAFGYFVTVKVDAFIEENRRLIEQENRKNHSQIRIAAESAVLLDSVAAQLEACSAANPYLEFFLSTGKAERILQRVLDGTMDIALMTEEKADNIGDSYGTLRIPCHTGIVIFPMLGLPVENLDEENRICIVWNKAVQSKSRDSVLSAIEAEYCTLKCGYADYLD